MEQQLISLEALKVIIKNRKNVNYMIGGISFFCAVLTLAIAQNYSSYIASVVILSLAGSSIILVSFCSVQSFEADTYITVFLGYFISFSMIGIVPLDAALITAEKNNKTNLFEMENKSDQFKVYWVVMYWIIFFITNFGYSLQQFFHNNGFIGFSKKIKSAFKQFIVNLGIGVIIFIALSIVCLFWLKIKGFDNVIAVAVVISNVFGISILAFLFGYGLVKVPFYLWNISEREQNLKELLCKTHQLFKEYQVAYWQFSDICIVSRKYQARIANQPDLSSYLEKLSTETPDPLNKPTGYRFQKNILYSPDSIIMESAIKLKSSGIINEDVLANIRHEIKIRQFQYERYIQKWKRICTGVFKLITEESMEEIDRKLSGVSSRSSSTNKDSKKQQSQNKYEGMKPVKVKTKDMHILQNIGFKFIAIILAFFSILIIFCEATLVFGSPNKALAFYQMIKNVTNVPGIITLILLVLFYVIFCTYFALGKLKVFGSFELFPYFTHMNTLIQNASTCLFLTFPLCYNIMLLFGIIDFNTESDGKTFQSGFDKFYDPMKEIPFFGHYYNIIVCFLIVIVGVASSFKKTQDFIQKLSKNKIKMSTLVEDDLMLKGELYILQEWQRMKQKEETKEILDVTEQDLPSQNQSGSMDQVSSDQSSYSQENKQDNEINSTNEENQEQKNGNNFIRKISNFFKRLSTTKSESQSNGREKSSSTQQIQLQQVNKDGQTSQNNIENSQSINLSLGDDESQKNIKNNLQVKLK